MVKLKQKDRIAFFKKNGKVELLKLDLGAGSNTKEGFTGVDNAPDSTAKVKHDLRVIPWPFKSESVEEVFSCHFFEHLTGPERILFMDELWRVMRVGAKAQIIVPYWSSMRSVQDPTHQWPPLCEASFLYFNRDWREQNKVSHYLGKCNFNFSYGFQLYPEVQSKAQEVQVFQTAHYVNSAMDLHVHLEKIK